MRESGRCMEPIQDDAYSQPCPSGRPPGPTIMIIGLLLRTWTGFQEFQSHSPRCRRAGKSIGHRQRGWKSATVTDDDTRMAFWENMSCSIQPAPLHPGRHAIPRARLQDSRAVDVSPTSGVLLVSVSSSGLAGMALINITYFYPGDEPLAARIFSCGWVSFVHGSKCTSRWY
jgi:hypothetical protein